MTTTIVTRSGKGSPLTNTELDANFTNLKTTADAALPAAGGTISGSLIITSDLEVQGTTTSIDSTVVEITDLNITLAKDATNNTQANGAGITIAGSNAELKYVSTGDKWTLNKNLEVTGTIEDSNGTFLPSSSVSTFGGTLIDDADAAAARTTLGLGTMATSSSSDFLPLSGGTLTGTLAFGDNTKLKFGNSQDLEIYHDGSASYIKENGTGDLIIQGSNTMRLQGSSNQELANLSTGGAVTLFHNGSAKLATTSTGIDVTGRIETTAAAGNHTVFNSTGADADFRVRTGADTHSFYVEGNTGNIGLGTSSPNGNGSKTTLHINSDTNGSAIRLSQSSNSSLIRYSDLAGLEIGTIASKTLKLETNDTTALTIDTSQNVNIPNGSLMIGATTAPSSKLELTDASTNGIAQIAFSNDAREYRFGVHGGVSDSLVLFDATASSTRFTLDTSGNATFSGTVTGGNGSFTNLTINATEKLRFDGSGGHTFIQESSNDTLTFATGNSTRMTLDANATFSGTISSGAITSSGDLKITTPSFSSKNIIFTEGGTDVIGIKYSGNVSGNPLDIHNFQGSGTTLVRVAENGNVNIPNGSLMVGATTAPSSYYAFANNLVVTGDSANRAGITISGTATSMINLSDGTGLVGFIDYNHSNDSMTLGTAESNALVIDSSQNVGIGTTSPDVLLDVEGSGSTPLFLSRKQSSVGPGVGLGFRQYDSANNLHSYASIFGVIEDNTNGAEDGGLVFHTSLASALGERMRITSSGNVGVGQTVPDAFAIGGAFTYLAVGGTKPGILNLVDDSTNGSYLQFGTNAGVRRASIHAVNGSHLAFTVNASNSGTGLTEAMRIKNNGYVGIGTTSPDQKLHVVGNAKVTGVFYADNIQTLSGTSIDFRHQDASTIMRVDTTNARVGIGTTSPDATLRIDNESGVALKVTGGAGGTSIASFVRDVGANVSINVHGDSARPQISLASAANTFSMGVIGSSFEIADSDALGSNTRLSIDSSGNFMVGKTTQGLSNAGFEVAQTGQASATQSGASCLRLNRLTSDGEILQFRKAGVTVGNIATVDGDLTIFSSASGHKGLRFGNGYIAPTANSTNIEDNAVDLGLTIARFKDLHLSNSVKNSSGALAVESGGGGQLLLKASSELTFSTNSAERMRIDSSGRVGIGESSPTSPLHVTHTGGTGVRLKTDGDTDSNLIHFKTSSNTGQGYIGTEGGTSGTNFTGSLAYSFLVGGTASGSRLQFLSAGQVRGTFDTNGLLGLGLTNPSGALHIKSDTNSNGAEIYLQCNNNNTSDGIGAIHFGNNVDNTLSEISSQTVGANTTSNLIFATSNAGTKSNKMIIDSSGRLGLGTTSPSQLLHVSGTGTVFKIESSSGFVDMFMENSSNTGFLNLDATKMNFYVGGGSASNLKMSILNGGNVGIGITSPSAKLQIQGGTSGLDQISISSNTTADTIKYAGIIMTNYANTTTALIGAKAENGTSSVFYGSSGTDHRGIQNHIFYTNASATATSGNTERMRIDSSGDVGIGTNSLSVITSSVSTLTLGGTNAGTSGGIAYQTNGTTEAYHYVTGDFLLHQAVSGIGQRFLTNNTERMRIDSSGNFLVGTTSSYGDKLNINGTGHFSSNLTLSRQTNDSGSTGLILEKTRNTSVNGNTVVQAGDQLGYIAFRGNDGDQFLDGAFILSFVDGTPSNNDMPTNLQFWTTSDGASSPSERVRIDNSGNFTIKGSNADLTLGSSGNDITFNRNSDNYINAQAGTSSNIVINPENRFVVNTADTERMRIHSNGAVGIGTTTTTGAGGLIVDNDIKTNSRFGVGSFGNTSTPAFYVLADTDTGIYFPDFNKLGFVTGGVERGRFESDGSFVINNSGGDAQLYLGGSSGTSRMYLARSGLDSLLYNVSNGNLRFGTNNTERARLTSGGNLLVGTTNETWQSVSGLRYFTGNSLIVTRDSNEPMNLNRLTNDGNLLTFRKDGTSFGNIGVNSGFFYIGGTEGTDAFLSFGSSGVRPSTSSGAARDAAIDLGGSSNRFKDAHFSGAVNITNTSGGSYFKAVQTSNVANAGLYMQSGSHNWYTLVDTSGRYQIYDGDAVAIRVMVDTSGKLLIGGTTSSASGTTSFSASGAGQINFNASSSAGQCLLLRRVNHNGNAITFENADEDEVGSITMSSNATAYNTSSDARLKDNIEDADESGNTIDAIKVRQFDWKNGKHQNHGMIAQELQKIVPEAVSGDAESEEMMGIDYSKLVPMLVKEIQSLRQRVAQLEE